jgi:hypothetical protein
MSLVEPVITTLDNCTQLTPEVLAQIYAEMDKIKKVDEHGNLVMTLEAIQLDGDIRYVMNEATPCLSLLDIVKVGTGKNNNDAGLWVRNHSIELQAMFNSPVLNLKFKGRGQKSTDLVTVDQAIQVLAKLPGPNGKRISEEIHRMGRRVIAGDQRMHDVIDFNAQKQGDIHVMARVATVLEAAGENALPVSIQHPQVLTQADLVKLKEDTIKEVKKEMQELIVYQKQTEKSKRTKELYDQKSARKHEHSVIQANVDADKKKKENEAQIEVDKKRKLDQAELEKQENERAIRAKALPVEERYDELEEKKHRRKLELLEKEHEVRMQPVVFSNPAVAQLPPLVGLHFVDRVGDHFGLFNGLTTALKIRVSNRAIHSMINGLNKLKPKGYDENPCTGKIQPHFNSDDIDVMRQIIESCKMEVMQCNIGYKN